MLFLRKADLFSKIKEDNLDVILKDKTGAVNETFLTDCIIAAQTQTESYLRHMFDVVFLFRPLLIYDDTTTYEIGDFVAFPTIDDTIFTALTASLNKQPDQNEDDWEESDPRDGLLKMIVGDIAIYHLHSRINPRNVPELRMQRRDEAIKWLEGIKKGDITPDFKLIVDDTRGFRGNFGTEEKKINSY